MRIRRSAIGPFLFAILLSNIQLQSASAAIIGSGTACEVSVSNSANIGLVSDTGARQCTYTFSYNATARTITLPANLVSATITLTGARGGQGGERYNTNAILPAVKATTYSSTDTWVGKYSGTIPSASSKQIEINTGNIGLDGQNFLCSGTSHPGPLGGTSSFISAGGGQGGSQGCGTPNVGEAGGTGGGGGGATVAVIDSIPIFAGGGGGTGGTGRGTDNDANLSGGGASNTNVSNYVSGSNAGASGVDVLQMSNTSCTSNIGGGGGGGGLNGGNGGIIGYHKCSTHDATAAGGGYPGLNSTSSLLTNTSISYILKSTDTTDSTVYGSVVIVLIYKGTTTATLSLPTGNLVYIQATIISDTSTVAGKITFRVNGKILTGCKNKVASANVVVTCSYKPSTHNAVTVTATLDPTSAEFIGTVSSSAQFLVANRTGPRVR